jgi:DNA primase
MYVCVNGLYRHRIVIPYYDRDGKLIYFNARAIGNEVPKYRGPPKELGIGKGDVIYMPRWSDIIPGDLVFVTEGEFDCLILSQIGYFSAALGGKEATETHMKLLKPYRIVLTADNDEAGLGALLKIGESVLKVWSSDQEYPLRYVRPPKGFKDWNELAEVHGIDVVDDYIRKRIKGFDANTIGYLRNRMYAS